MQRNFGGADIVTYFTIAITMRRNRATDTVAVLAGAQLKSNACGW